MSIELVHNLGLELPVFDSGTAVAWTTEAIKATASQQAQERGSFVRRTVLSFGRASCPDSLRDSLHLADSAIDRLCDVTDTIPVSYCWGLYKGLCPETLQNSAYDSSKPLELIPRGFSLVASVEAITGAEIGGTESIQLDRSISEGELNSTYCALGSIIMWDVTANQFVTNQRTGRVTLVDIEPRLNEVF